METRSNKQNRALHLGIRMIADTLNDAGLDMRTVLKPGVDIPWTEESAKENLYKPIMKAMTGKDSTTQLDTKEVGDVFEVLVRHLNEKFGGFADFPSFPSIEELSTEKEVVKDVEK